MRILTLALTVVAAGVLGAVGCGRSEAPRLSYASITYGEGYAPLPFAVAVRNDGEASGYVDRVEARVLSVTPIPGRGLELPAAEDFRRRVVLFGHEEAGDNAEPLPAGQAMALPPGKTSEVWCALEWDLPEDAPPMLVVCSASFVLSYQGSKVLATPPVAVMLQSRQGVLEQMTAAPMKSRKRAAKIVEILNSAEGAKSTGVTQLLDHLQTATP